MTVLMKVTTPQDSMNRIFPENQFLARMKPKKNKPLKRQTQLHKQIQKHKLKQMTGKLVFRLIPVSSH
jgi:hypothetical protein